jgi:hypothetical protein
VIEPTVQQIADQLIDRERQPLGEQVADPVGRLVELLDQLDPQVAAHGLHLLVLGRPPEPGSAAAAATDPAALAYDLLCSAESRTRPVPRRDQLLAEVVARLTRAAWGVPADATALTLLADADAAFVLAGHRVAFGRPPTAAELADAHARLVAGDGREVLLRAWWADERAVHRLYGPRPEGWRGRLAGLRRSRQLAVFRAHVLAAEGSAVAVLSWLSELPRVGTGPTESEVASAAATADALQAAAAGSRDRDARLREIAAGLRSLSGPDQW